MHHREYPTQMLQFFLEQSGGIFHRHLVKAEFTRYWIPIKPRTYGTDYQLKPQLPQASVGQKQFCTSSEVAIVVYWSKSNQAEMCGLGIEWWNLEACMEAGSFIVKLLTTAV